MAKIGLLPSTQQTSSGNGIGNYHEAELVQDVTKRLQPKLISAGHVAQIFAGQQEANSDGARALVSWNPQIAVSLHLDASDGGGHGALLCYQEERSKAMGMQILSIYCTSMNYRNRGAMKRTPGVSGVAVIRIPEQAGIPTALIEMGSMDKPDGPLWLEPDHREKAAEAMCRAICSVAGGATPQPKIKEDGMLYEGDGKKFVFEDCYVARYNYFLHTRGESKEITFTLTSHETQIPKTSDGQDLHGHKVHNLQDVAAYSKTLTKGSYVLECDSDDGIHWALREERK